MHDDLDAIRKSFEERLARAASDRWSPMHTPVVATSDADVRVMVLRDFDRATATLRFHTDVRAPKVTAIGGGASVGALFYDKAEKVQLRVRGEGRVESDGPRADAAWAQSDNFARRCYLGTGPGAPSEGPTSGLPDWAEGIQPTDEQVAPAREHFAILLVEAREVDWFSLAHDGHRRALFTRESEMWEGRWIAP